MRNCWNAGCSIWMRPGSSAIRKKGNFQAANPLCGSCAVQLATTLGANTFSMAVAGPFVSYFLFSVLKRLPVNKKISIFLAAFLGDLITYCVTAFQLAIAHNSATSFSAALRENMIIFAGTQLPLAVVEGILTVVVIIGLEAYARPELKAVGFLKEEY